MKQPCRERVTCFLSPRAYSVGFLAEWLNSIVIRTPNCAYRRTEWTSCQKFANRVVRAITRSFMSGWSKCCFTFTETVGLLGTEAQDSHLSWLSHSSCFMSVMMMMSWCLMSSDVIWHIRDKLWPMPKHGSIILYVHGNQKARHLGRTAQDVHLDSHTAPELWMSVSVSWI